MDKIRIVGFILIFTLSNIVFFGVLMIGNEFTIHKDALKPFIEEFGDDWSALEYNDILVVRNGEDKIYSLLGVTRNFTRPILSLQKSPGSKWLGENREKIPLSYLKKKTVLLVKRNNPEYSIFLKRFRNGS